MISFQQSDADVAASLRNNQLRPASRITPHPMVARTGRANSHSGSGPARFAADTSVPIAVPIRIDDKKTSELVTARLS
jgi:hypothetical protein